MIAEAVSGEMEDLKTQKTGNVTHPKRSTTVPWIHAKSDRSHFQSLLQTSAFLVLSASSCRQLSLPLSNMQTTGHVSVGFAKYLLKISQLVILIEIAQGGRIILFTGWHSYKHLVCASKTKITFLFESGREWGGRVESNKSLRPKVISVKLFKQVWFCIHFEQTDRFCIILRQNR